jgi:hypothetical protein
MSRRRILLILGAAALAASMPARSEPARAERKAGCAEGAREPAYAPLRPTQTALCSYGAEELNRRLLGLFAFRPSDLKIEAFERLFGLPLLHTAFDDPRVASYTIILAAAPGHGDWKLQLTFQEGFWPMIKTRPIRFRGTKRPVLIDPRRRGDIRVHLLWLAPQPMQAGAPECLPLAALRKAARRQGWRARSNMIQMSHGLPIPVQDFVRRPITLSTDLGNPVDCINDLALTADANPPSAPITPEERAGFAADAT